jgi:hypothetical protein
MFPQNREHRKGKPMTARYSVLADVPKIGQDPVPSRVVVIVSDDEGRSWRPYTPIFPVGQTEVAFTIAEAMNARASGVDVQAFQLALMEDA